MPIFGIEYDKNITHLRLCGNVIVQVVAAWYRHSRHGHSAERTVDAGGGIQPDNRRKSQNEPQVSVLDWRILDKLNRCLECNATAFVQPLRCYPDAPVAGESSIA